MNDDELKNLFQRSRREESWPEPLPDPAAIWRRARAAELFEEELRRREWAARPLRTARSLAGWAALVAAELAVLAGFSELPPPALAALAQAGVAPWTAVLLILATLPVATLLYRMRRDS
jgi:hypothetical protein